MLKRITRIAAGVVVAMLIIIAIEWIGHQTVPVPAGVDPAILDFAEVPLPALAFLLVGWFLGTLGGGAVANHLTGLRWPCWIVTALVLVGAVVNFAKIGHPPWMVAFGLAMPVLAGWIISRRVPRVSAEAP